MTAPTVLQVLPALDAGGVERGTLEIADAIVRAGGRALVASAGGRLVPALEALGARHVTLPLATKRPWRMVANAASIARLVRAERVAIVHARSRAPAWSALWAARRTGAHFVTTYHGTYNEGFPGKRLYNSVMARGDRVIAISRFIQALIEARHGTDPARIRLIPRGVDPARFDPDAVAPARVAALRDAWGVPDATPIILLPGRITRWKGQGVLVEAMARLPRAAAAPVPGEDPAPVPGDPGALLVGEAAGRAGFAAELQARIAALGLEGRVRLVGHTEDMPAALLLADIVVHASTDAEAFGRTVIEAQAMARPVIAADLGAPRETVLEGVTGWRVPPGDPAALAAAIGAVLAMPAAERASIGAAARAAVLRHYTTAAMQTATLAVYAELAG